MCGTPAVVTHTGPSLGQHNDQVLRESPGMSGGEIVGAVSAGTVERAGGLGGQQLSNG